MRSNVDKAALAQLMEAKPLLSKQQYKTLRGQILAGDPRGAIKGLGKILRRREDFVEETRRRVAHILGVPVNLLCNPPKER